MMEHAYVYDGACIQLKTFCIPYKCSIKLQKSLARDKTIKMRGILNLNRIHRNRLHDSYIFMYSEFEK